MANTYKQNPEYPASELTEKLIGFAYQIYKELGYGLLEKIYQRAFEECLESSSINYSREKYGKISFNNTVVGRYFLDFLVEGKVAVELKVRNEIYQSHIMQTLNYIKSEKLPVGLILVFAKNGLKIKRLANTRNSE